MSWGSDRHRDGWYGRLARHGAGLSSARSPGADSAKVRKCVDVDGATAQDRLRIRGSFSTIETPCSTVAQGAAIVAQGVAVIATRDSTVAKGDSTAATGASPIATGISIAANGGLVAAAGGSTVVPHAAAAAKGVSILEWIA